MGKITRLALFFTVCIFSLVLSSCSKSTSPAPVTVNFMTWVSGSIALMLLAIIAGGIGETGIPGARYGSVSWFDGTNLWLFGGYGYNATTTCYLNDLWKFDGTNWTWVSGSSIMLLAIIAEIGGNPHTGAKLAAVSWYDNNGNLWLFGGYGYNATTTGYLNDLWEFDVSSSTWTWVSGSSSVAVLTAIMAEG